MPGNVGFFLMPPATAGGSPAAMSAPLTYGIAAKAKNADCAAFFLNWVATNDDGPPDRRRRRRLEPRWAGGCHDAVRRCRLGHERDARRRSRWSARPARAMDFIANSTSSIFAQGWTPELQKMVGGKEDAAGLLKAVQAEYLRELAQQ